MYSAIFLESNLKALSKVITQALEKVSFPKWRGDGSLMRQEVSLAQVIVCPLLPRSTNGITGTPIDGEMIS